MSLETLILQAFEASSGSNVRQRDLFKEVKKMHQQTCEKGTNIRGDGADISSSTFEKKAAKKILKKLLESGSITLIDSETKLYCYQSNATNTTPVSMQKVSDSRSQGQEMNQKKDKTPLPFAETLRKRKKHLPRKEELEIVSKVDVNVDIDEEIRRLEAELAADSGSSSGSEGDGDSEDEVGEDADSSDRHSESPRKKGVISLSTLATDRIAALPDTLLPTNKRRTLKNIDKVLEDEPSPKSKKRKKNSAGASANGSNSNISDGLRAAVKEVLDGYTPRSNEKIPFYCRVCAKQYKNRDDFFDHKKSDFHKVAVDLEKKASYCKLCRKQLTSPVQLKEHIHSKPHKERLSLMKSRQLPGTS